MSNNPNPQKRQVQLFSTINPGDQFKSFKTRPNNPCLCGSGLKQKKCHGNGGKLMSTNKKNTVTKLPETTNQQPETTNTPAT